MGDLSATGEVERLHIFSNDLAVDVYYTFLDYKPSSSDSIAIEGSVTQLGRLDAWIAAALTCLTQ